jgi:hypothetical protein
VLRGVIYAVQHTKSYSLQPFASVPGIDDAQINRPLLLMASVPGGVNVALLRFHIYKRYGWREHVAQVGERLASAEQARPDTRSCFDRCRP